MSISDIPSIVTLSNSGKKHIVVLYGGMSPERDISIISGQSVGKGLIELGYKVTLLDMNTDLVNNIISLKPDIVFNALHGTYGEDGCVSGILNILKIPYTSSGILASSIAMDKKFANNFFLFHGIKSPKSIILDKKDVINFSKKPPYVIKPINQGSSIGIQVILPEDNFQISEYEFLYGDQVMIEDYIKGKEIQVAVLNGKALGALELKILENRFFDYHTKYTEGAAQHIMPARLNKKNYQKSLDIAEKVYHAIGCRGIARVEFIYKEQEDELYFFEINTNPGMTPISICPDIALYFNISFNQLLETILSSATYDK